MRSALIPIIAFAASLTPPLAASAETAAERCARTARAGDVAACRAAVEADPQDLASRRSLAHAYLAANDEENCYRVHREILARVPDDAHAHFDYAVALMAFGRYLDAVEPARAALRLESASIDIVRLAALVFETARQDEEALQAFARGAELGDRLLMFDLASAYARGRGTATDPLAAVHWLERAAESGHVTAMAMLSDIYRDGRDGVAPDPARAAHWAARAKAEGAAD